MSDKIPIDEKEMRVRCTWDIAPHTPISLNLHPPFRIETREFTSIYLNLIQKALDCCIELQMVEIAQRKRKRRTVQGEKTLISIAWCAQQYQRYASLGYKLSELNCKRFEYHRVNLTARCLAEWNAKDESCHGISSWKYFKEFSKQWPFLEAPSTL